MSKPSSNYRVNLRPSEKVMRFFEEELAVTHAANGTRLPTIKEVASHLNVGISTVQSVFAQLAKQGKVVTIAGKGTFYQAPSTTATDQAPQRITITVLIHKQELTGTESTWGKEICAGMLLEAAHNPQNKLHIQPFFSDTNSNDSELIQAEIEHTHGAIAFTGSFNRQLAKQFEKAGVPTIYITPSSSLSTTNFVGPDFLSVCTKIGKAWRKNRRRHVLVLLHDLLANSTTAEQSLSGIKIGLQELTGQQNVKLTYYSVDPIHLEDVNQRLEEAFDHAPPPDAIYTSGDIIANMAVEWLLNRNIRVPEDVSVIGGTGLHPGHNAPLTCTVLQQPFEALGREAVRMVLRAIQNNNQPQPGKYLSASLREGKTTRSAENLHLGL